MKKKFLAMLAVVAAVALGSADGFVFAEQCSSSCPTNSPTCVVCPVDNSDSSDSSDAAAAAATGGDGITQTGDRGSAGEGKSASGNRCGGVNTSIINCSDSEDDGGGIFAILVIILNVLTFGVGIAGTLGIVIVGIMYLTARDNEAQMTKAKNMFVNIVIGLAVYAVMWAFLQWLLPGGII